MSFFSTFLSIAIATLVASPHCIGMCGGFPGLCVSSGQPQSSLFGYHVGRLFSYASLGVVAAVLGDGVQGWLANSGITAAMEISLGFTLFAIGLVYLLLGMRIPVLVAIRSRIAAVVARVFIPVTRRAMSIRLPLIRGLVIGCSSALLPCGLVYAMLPIAAVQHGLWQSIAIMSALWAGTLPAMVGCGAVIRLLHRRFAPVAPYLTGIVLCIGGLSSVLLHKMHSIHQNGEHSVDHQGHCKSVVRQSAKRID